MRKLILTMLAIGITGWPAVCQQVKQVYEILHNDKPVGQMMVIKSGNDQDFTIKQIFNANIDLFIKQVVIQGQEEAHFEKGRLKHSSIFRKVNEKVKVNKQTKETNGKYFSFDGTTWHPIKASDIRFHLLSILFYEPTDNQKVYSDNLEAEAKVSEITSHVYQIPLSNGSFNTYTFRAGICKEIKLNSKYASLTLKLL